MNPDQAILSAISQNTPDKQARAESILEIAWRRKGLVLFVLFASVMIAALILVTVPKRMTAGSKVLITRNLPLNAAGGQAEATNFLNTQAELVKSATVLSRALDGPGIESLEFFPESENAINYLKERLEVVPVPDASVLQVKLASTRPEEAVQLVDAVVKSYVAHVADQKKNVALDAYGKIAADRQKLDGDRTNAKRQLLSMQAEVKSTGGGDKGNSVAQENLKTLSAALTQAKIDSVNLRSQFEDSLKAVGMKPDKIDDAKLNEAMGAGAENLPVIRRNLTGLNQQLIEAKRQFVPTHPAVRKLQADIRDYQLAQAAVLRSMVETAKNKEIAAQKLYNEQSQFAQEVDAKQAEMLLLDDRVKTLDQQIAVLDSKLQQMTVTENVGFAASELDATAVIDPNSASPNSWRMLAFAGVIGVCLGTLSALLREWVSPSLGASVHKIADQVGVPVLGTLPRVAGRTGRDMAMLTHDQSDSEAAEAFRSIRTSMLFGAGQCHTITVTSPAPKDGKTTLAANLAISLAQSGKRVALVDANFREPTLHGYFAVENDVGLTSVLGGDEVESAMRRTAVEHLDVLTAGPKSTEASEQLNSSRFGDLLRDLNLRYDHVIFDTSSVTGSNDARIIAAGCDQTILVVRGERTNRFATTTARDALLSVGATLMGIVLNDSAKPTQAYPPSVGERRSGDANTPNDRSAELAKRLRAGR